MIVKFFLVNELSFWLRNNSQHVFFLLENYIEMKDLKLVVIDSQRFLKLELEIISLVTKIINIFVVIKISLLNIKDIRIRSYASNGQYFFIQVR